jgi:hypothetical protein
MPDDPFGAPTGVPRLTDDGAGRTPAPAGFPLRSPTGAVDGSGAAPAGSGAVLLSVALGLAVFGLVPPGIGCRISVLLRLPRPSLLALALERPG